MGTEKQKTEYRIQNNVIIIIYNYYMIDDMGGGLVGFFESFLIAFSSLVELRKIIVL